MAIQQILVYRLYLFFVEGGVQEVGYIVPAAIAAYQVYLVLHQRDQRTDNDRHSFADDRRQLVAKALARPGGKDGQHGSPREQLADDRGSILDAVNGDTHDLLGKIGADDRRKMDEYLTGIREIEKRIRASIDARGHGQRGFT